MWDIIIALAGYLGPVFSIFPIIGISLFLCPITVKINSFKMKYFFSDAAFFFSSVVACGLAQFPTHSTIWLFTHTDKPPNTEQSEYGFFWQFRSKLHYHTMHIGHWITRNLKLVSYEINKENRCHKCECILKYQCSWLNVLK